MVIQLFNPVFYLRLVANMILRNKAEVILRHTIFIAVLSILPKLNLLKRKEILSFEGYGYNYDSCFNLNLHFMVFSEYLHSNLRKDSQ